MSWGGPYTGLWEKVRLEEGRRLEGAGTKGRGRQVGGRERKRN